MGGRGAGWRHGPGRGHLKFKRSAGSSERIPPPAAGLLAVSVALGVPPLGEVLKHWSRTDGLAWLGELQAYTWRNDSDTIRFLKPWSQGRFSDQQWENLQHIFLVYRISFTRDIRNSAARGLAVQRPRPRPGRLLLGCHVSGFYPNPVWAMWMRGEQEQPGTREAGPGLPGLDRWLVVAFLLILTCVGLAFCCQRRRRYHGIM
ncbi:Antigen-presenting glycoprotein CD1d [Camelus dromedarius]|uniref:Antigen-presenting glycoprotein CD1d n=1 Tax=Camelus dromedarius TaxID=9838 RepID=A0A5N4CN76_CAMDR|nr:Antigen-presenting glycoprotein CD1d [Camelus dromedarius]